MLTFLPALLLMMTSFTRIIIVLSLLRQAMGLQTTPPNQVLVGLALFMTFFVMSPVLGQSLYRRLQAAVGRHHQRGRRRRSRPAAVQAVHAAPDP